MPRPTLLLATPPEFLPPSLVATTRTLAQSLGADVEILTVDNAYEEVDPRTGLAEVPGVAAKVRHRAEPVFDGPVRSLREVTERVRVEVTFGRPVDCIVARADILRPAYILVATHGRTGMRRALLGSVAEGVLRAASCPVVVVPPRADG